MPTIKIWNIKGERGKSATQNLKNSIDYIKDNLKTVENSKDEEGLSRAISYTSNNQKTMQGRLVRGYLCTVENAAKEFELVRENNLYKSGKEKDTGNIAYHMVISWKNDERITGEEAVDYAMEFMKRLGHHQAVIAVHTNTDNIHAHIVFNSHTMEPLKDYGSVSRMKYDDNTKSYYKLQKMNDKLSMERGYHVVKPKKYYDKSTSWYEHYIKDRTDEKGNLISSKETIKAKLDSILIVSQSKKEYFKLCEDAGIDIQFRGENISYKYKEEGNPMRASTLGAKYTNNGLNDHFKMLHKEFEEVIVDEEELKENNIKFNQSIEKVNIPKNLNPVNDYIFKVSKYHDGRKRGLIETGLLIAINSLRKQKYTINNHKASVKINTNKYLTPMEKKIQENIKILSIVEELKLNTLEDLNNRLVVIGKDMYKVRGELKKSYARLNTLDEGYKLIEKIEKNESLTDTEYKLARNIGINNNDITKFEENIIEAKKNHEILLSSENMLKKDYSKLKRVERQYSNSISEKYVTEDYKQFEREIDVVRDDVKNRELENDLSNSKRSITIKNTNR